MSGSGLQLHRDIDGRRRPYARQAVYRPASQYGVASAAPGMCGHFVRDGSAKRLPYVVIGGRQWRQHNIAQMLRAQTADVGRTEVTRFREIVGHERLQAVRHATLELKLKSVVMRVPGVPDCGDGDIVAGSHECRGNDVIRTQSSAIGPEIGCRQSLFPAELPLNGGTPPQGDRTVAGADRTRLYRARSS